MIALLARFSNYLMAGMAVMIVVLSGLVWLEHHNYISTLTEYSDFKADVKAKGEAAIIAKLKKEKEDAETIRIAVASRDSALIKLRQHQASAASSRLPFLPASTENRVCLNRTQFESAIGDLVTDLQEIAGTGDLALIDLQTFISSWPK